MPTTTARPPGWALVVFAAVLAVLPGAGATASAAEPATSDGTVSWSVVPASDEGPDGRISLRHVVDPGQIVSDAIAVTNLGTQRTAFTVVAGDGILGADGAFDVAAGEPVDSGSWIGVGRLTDGQVVLDAGETAVLPVTIAVPGDATPGDHPAGIVVGVSTTDGTVSLTHRVGVRLHLRVVGDIVPALQVGSTTASFSPSWIPFAPGTLRVEYQVTNAGNVRLGASAGLEVAGPRGTAEARGSGRIDELLPGDVATAAIELDAWPLFALAGDLTLTALAVGEDQVALPPAVTADVATVAVSWTGVAVLVLLVVMVVVAVRRWRRRASQRARLT